MLNLFSNGRHFKSPAPGALMTPLAAAVLPSRKVPAGQILDGAFNLEEETNGRRYVSAVAVTDRFRVGNLLRRFFPGRNRHGHRLGKLLAVSPAIWRPA